MTFYFRPPNGFISYQKMEMYALNRLKFLIRLNACKDNEEQFDVIQDAQAVLLSECLIEGTVKDKISHYLLRLVLGNSPETSQFFFEAETALFHLRLRSFSENEWKKFFMSLDRVLLLEHYKDMLRGLKQLFSILENHFGSICAMTKEFAHLEKSVSVVKVPFQLLLNLVATRRVHLKQGMAFVPLSLMIDVLAEQFHEILSNITRWNQTSVKRLFADERILRLECVVKRAFMNEVYPSRGLALKSDAIRLASLKQEMHLFPPCMYELMNALQKHHRLHHHDRIQLTLFLKELGLPLHEALLFWKREYSQDCVPSVSTPGRCAHSWQGNERRYTYSIRHLHGLEGSRICYRAHSCHSIQGKQLSPSASGCCPFVHTDIESLSSLLKRHEMKSSPALLNGLSHLTSSKHFGKACHRFMSHKLTCFGEQGDSNVNEAQENLNSPLNLKSKNVFFNFQDVRKETNDSCRCHAFSCAELENGEKASSSGISGSSCSFTQIKKSDHACVKRSIDHLQRTKSVESVNRRLDGFSSKFDSFSTDTHESFEKLSSLHVTLEVEEQTVIKYQTDFSMRTLGDVHDGANNNTCHYNSHNNNNNSFLEPIKKNLASAACMQVLKYDASELQHQHSNDSSNSLSSSRLCTSPLWHIPKRRKICDCGAVNEWNIVNDKSDDKCINKPSYYYWSFKSLVEGLKKCESLT